MDMRLPDWVRLVILVSALMQLTFGMTLLVDPTRIADMWPWPLPPLSARLLGASTLVSVPMAILAIGVNRFAVAMIPLVMMLTYRVLQLLAGVIHFDRFDTGSLATANYFGGGLLMLIAFGYPLWAGLVGRLPPAAANAPLGAPAPWRPGALLRMTLVVLAAAYVLLGLVFLVQGGAARVLWIDAGGMTPLTARLFASPLIGLGLGMYLVSRASDWRQAFVPAIGMITIGVAGTLSLFLDRAMLETQNAVGGLVAATPLILLCVGAAIVARRPAPQAARA